MGLIRANEAPPTIATFSMSDIEKQAHAIIMRAKSQAARILIEAQRIGEESKKEAIETGTREGREAGHAEGLEQGRAAGEAAALAEQREALTRLTAAMTTLLTELDATRSTLESQAVSSVIELAIGIARKVTRRAALSDPTIVSANCADALKMTVRAHDLRIAVNPAQRETLAAALPKLQMSMPALKHVELNEDESIAPGGCRITTDTGGLIDAELETQIERIATELLPESALGVRS
jgi:flagellar assembly protein FliH